MAEREKSEWAVNLSNAIKEWLPEHGYKASTQLAQELDIPSNPWQGIYQADRIVETTRELGKDIFDGRIYYARLKLWTDLEQADPRAIPDRKVLTPRGKLTFKKRNMTNEEYGKWLEGPEARELHIKKSVRFGRDLSVGEYHRWLLSPEAGELLGKEQIQAETHRIVETPTNHQSASFPDTYHSVGSLIDQLLGRATGQAVDLILERIRQEFGHQIGLKQEVAGLKQEVAGLKQEVAGLKQEVIEGLEDSFTKFASQLQVPEQSARSRPPRAEVSISNSANQLSRMLEKYYKASKDERDTLMRDHGTALMSLAIRVHTLTRPANEREQLLKLSKETKL